MAIVNVRCPESGKLRFADWEPIPEEDYPGAVVCVCAYEVVFLKGSYNKKTGVGRLRDHTSPTCDVCDAPEFSITHDRHLEEEPMTVKVIHPTMKGNAMPNFQIHPQYLKEGGYVVRTPEELAEAALGVVCTRLVGPWAHTNPYEREGGEQS